MLPLQIANKTVGKGFPCFIAAEIGINFNGSLQLAKDSISAAVDSGADAVKFQNYRTEDFIADHSLTYEYVSQGKKVVESQYAMFKRCELTREWLFDLAEFSRKLGVIFHSTPTNFQGVADLVAVGAPVIKNGSDYLTHLELIEAMGKTGLPVVISTGMANLCEIEDAVNTFRAAGNDKLILLHCTSSYPTPPLEVNLSRIETLSCAFGCLSGFSDHTEGVTAAVGAAALGAVWIEKHFTLDKNLPGPDHSMSADPAEFKQLVQAVRTLEKNIGTPIIAPTASEQLNRPKFRLSCTAAVPLKSGHILQDADIVFKRPGTGLPPKFKAMFLGKKLVRDIPAGKIIEAEDFIL